MPPPSFSQRDIRLFQPATICTVWARAAATIPEEFARVPTPIRHRGGLRAVSGGLPLAERLRLSPLRASAGLRDRESTLAVRRVPAPGIADGRHDSAQYKDAAHPMVLGRVPDDDRQAGRLGTLDPASARAAALRNGLDDAAQTAPSDGQRRTGAPAWGHRTRRHVGGWQPLRPALRKGAASVVPFADRVVGNLQNWLIGTHHGVSRAQLQ